MTLWSTPSLKRLTQRCLQKRKERQPFQIAKAEGKAIWMSPVKVKRVLNQIQGCSYEEALVLLRFLPYRACHPVSKVLKSAAANARHNLSIPPSYLHVEHAFVEKALIHKRSRFRAKGKIYPRKKRTSTICIFLRSKISRFDADLKTNFLPLKLTK